MVLAVVPESVSVLVPDLVNVPLPVMMPDRVWLAELA